jgi:hypothetical protein
LLGLGIRQDDAAIAPNDHRSVRKGFQEVGLLAREFLCFAPAHSPSDQPCHDDHAQQQQDHIRQTCVNNPVVHRSTLELVAYTSHVHDAAGLVGIGF